MPVYSNDFPSFSSPLLRRQDAPILQRRKLRLREVRVTPLFSEGGLKRLVEGVRAGVGVPHRCSELGNKELGLVLALTLSDTGSSCL